MTETAFLTFWRNLSRICEDQGVRPPPLLTVHRAWQVTQSAAEARQLLAPHPDGGRCPWLT